jgi:ribosomal protein S18 acetylase RimI-like enzyme
MEVVALQQSAIRPLQRDDLEAVVAIDAASYGRTRRGYFERRLDAALREPRLHAQFAASVDEGLAGYILARVMEGEFGRRVPALRLEIIGVRRELKGRHIGAALFDALCDFGRRHDIAEIRTQCAWNDHAMMRWLDGMGFALAPNHIVDCAVAGGEYRPARDESPERFADEAPREIDYGATPANDFEHLARDNADVRAMDDRDLPQIVRIDRRLTGRDRDAYMRHKLAEAMHGSAIRVSLTARMDGVIVGFLMARADLGDFGRIEPVAVIDTIGVDPGYAHHGVGHALLSQLFANLGALRIERVETVVAPRDFPLLGFLYEVGFLPSQRLPFVRMLN